MSTWKDVLVKANAPIRSAIKTIDTAGMQIALVVDDQGCLLGTVTDGDVRSAILRGVSLTASVQKIMNHHPITAQSNQSRERFLSIMSEHKIHQVPLLDTKGRVTGIEFIDDLIKEKKKENIVVIMAGGLGSRLRPLTNDCPKPLLHVGQKPILETILENFIEHGFETFYVAVNYKDEMIKKYFGNGKSLGCKIRYLSEKRKLGTAGALSLLPLKPRKPVIVMNGDLLTKINFNQLLDFHRQHKASATMCIREYDLQVPYGVVKMNEHLIREIEEKPIHKFFVNAGIYVFEPKVFRRIPRNKPLDMPRLLQSLTKAKQHVAAFPIREYWLDIGRMDDLDRANQEFTTIFNNNV